MSPLLSSFLGNSLVTLTFHLLNQYGLIELFQLDMVKLRQFIGMSFSSFLLFFPEWCLIIACNKNKWYPNVLQINSIEYIFTYLYLFGIHFMFQSWSKKTTTARTLITTQSMLQT